MRFLGLGIGDTVPDAKTVWLFREQLTEAKLIKKLFKQLDRFPRKNGFFAKKDQIVNASIVSVPNTSLSYVLLYGSDNPRPCSTVIYIS